MDAPRRILIIRPSALGDVCRTVGVLAVMRRAYPDAMIDWLVQDSFAGAIESHPALSNVIAFPRRDLGKSCRRGRIDIAVRWMNQNLRKRYDLVLDAQGLARSGLFAWWTRAPRRVGFANAQEGASLAYTDRVRMDWSMHAVERMHGLLGAIGLDPTPDPDDLRLHADGLALSDVVAEHAEPFVVLAPTSRWASKRWGGDRFTDLAVRLLDAGTKRVVVVGAPSERDQCAPLIELAKQHRLVTDRVGSTSVPQLMALIARARLVVANDSAALHMGVGFERALVALYGPTDVSRVGPYGREADVIQHLEPGDSLDHKNDANGRLMERISVDEVFEACAERLGC